jgi:hypothetical protein
VEAVSGQSPPAVTLGLPAIITTKLILPRHIRIYCYYGYYSANLLLGSTTKSSSNCDTSMCFDLPTLPLPFAFAFALRSRSCMSGSNREATFRDGFRTRPDRRGSLSLLVPSLSALAGARGGGYTRRGHATGGGYVDRVLPASSYYGALAIWLRI